MLNEDVRAGKDLGFVTVLPADEVGRRSILAKDLQYLGVSRLLSLLVSSNHEAITGLGAQHRFVS